MKKALVVGINYYNTECELYGCINDSINLANFLINRGYEVVSLIEGTNNEPTRDNIINELNKLITSDATKLFFSYSGHGTYIQDISGDEKDGKDECIVDVNSKLIVDDEFNNILLQVRSNQTMFCIMDSCHSGTVLDLCYNYNINNSMIEDSLSDSNFKGEIVMLSGCLDNQYSADTIINNQPQGALTGTFLNIYPKLEKCTYLDLICEIRKKLKKDGYDQIPNLSSSKYINLYKELSI